MKASYLFLISATALVSCGPTAYEEHIEEFKECLEQKQEEKAYTYSNIQEALNAYDFEVARDYLACHPSRDCFYDNGKSTECNSWADKRPYLDDLTLIVTAEITYFISEGEFKRAESAAKEANLMELYVKIASEGFEENLDDMIERKEFKKIHSYLSDKRFEYQKTEYRLDTGASYNGNDRYQDKAREFNALLDKVLSKYVFDEVETKYVKQIIDLSLPELVDVKSNACKLSDVYKKEATAKYLNTK